MEGADAESAAIEDGLLGFRFPFRVSLAYFLSCCYRKDGALILISNRHSWLKSSCPPFRLLGLIRLFEVISSLE